MHYTNVHWLTTTNLGLVLDFTFAGAHITMGNTAGEETMAPLHNSLVYAAQWLQAHNIRFAVDNKAGRKQPPPSSDCPTANTPRRAPPAPSLGEFLYPYPTPATPVSSTYSAHQAAGEISFRHHQTRPLPQEYDRASGNGQIHSHVILPDWAGRWVGDGTQPASETEAPKY